MAILKHNNNSISNVTSFAQIPAGEPVLLSTATASSSASIEFNSTYINSDYKIYMIEINDSHPSTDDQNFYFNLSTDNGSNYNVTKTTTFFQTYHSEADATEFGYNTFGDLAQSTAQQSIGYNVGNGADETIAVKFYLFNPSSTTYVKHFLITTNVYNNSNGSRNVYVAGYGNTVSAVNAVKFNFGSGNIDAGTFKLYGIGAN